MAAIGWVSTVEENVARGHTGLPRLKQIEADKRATPVACCAGSTRLARRDRQKPHQQPKQKQGADQRKQGVPGVEMEVGIAIETMPCRQHETLLACVGHAKRRLDYVHFLTIPGGFLLFFPHVW